MFNLQDTAQTPRNTPAPIPSISSLPETCLDLVVGGDIKDPFAGPAGTYSDGASGDIKNPFRSSK